MYTKKYYLAHREAILTRNRKWKQENPEKVRAYSRANRAKVAAQSKKWRQENPERVRAYKQLERVKVRNYFTLIEWRRKWQPNQEQLAHRL